MSYKCNNWVKSDKPVILSLLYGFYTYSVISFILFILCADILFFELEEWILGS